MSIPGAPWRIFLGARQKSMIACFQQMMAAKERNVMRIFYTVLMLLAFLTGCAARPVIQNQKSASVLPGHQYSGAQCAGPNWNVCR
jgi:hypothetical protein